ncbi:hypothetical protein RKLH11_1111 [Rhodobacteraceae bacterium KLH11]|nr:hypothetical protein RKLH11_1111 [Rhodobacteraceae bacterium KLH11]
MGGKILKSGAFGAAILLAVSACQSTPAGDAAAPGSRAEFRSELPPEVYDFAFANAMAEQIVSGCRSLKLNRSAVAEKTEALSQEFEARGYTESDFRHLGRNLPLKRLQDDTIRYIQTNGIVLSDPSTFCTAGQREIANGTQIGAFLKG